MKRVILVLLFIVAFTIILTPDGAAKDKAGLDDYITRHDARVISPGLLYDILSQKGHIDELGISLFSDTRINNETSADRFRHQYSAMTLLSEGRVLAGWEDDRNGDIDIFGQVLSAAGTASGPDQLLISDEQFLSQSMLDFTFNSDGRVISSWVDESGDLWLRRYDSTFTPLSDPIKVNDNFFVYLN